MQRWISKPKEFRNRKFCLSVFEYHGTWYFKVVHLGCTTPELWQFLGELGGCTAPRLSFALKLYVRYHGTLVRWYLKTLRRLSKIWKYFVPSIIFQTDYHIIYTLW